MTGSAHSPDPNLDDLTASVAPDGPGLPPPRAVKKKPRKTQDDRRQEVRANGPPPEDILLFAPFPSDDSIISRHRVSPLTCYS